MLKKEYILNFKKMIKGDIILTSEKKSIMGYIVRLGTQSKYSHAYIYMGNYCYEIDGNGVIQFNIEKKLYRKFDKVMIRRLKTNLTEELILELENYLKEQRGAKYNNIMAIDSKLNIINKIIDGEFFCSHLVAKAYEKIEIKLCPKKESHKITPKDLYETEILQTIEEKESIIKVSKEGLMLIKSRPNTSEKLQKAERFLVENAPEKSNGAKVVNLNEFFKMITKEILSEEDQKRIIKSYKKIKYFTIFQNDLRPIAISVNLEDMSRKQEAQRDFIKNAKNHLFSIESWFNNVSFSKNELINNFFIINYLEVSKKIVCFLNEEQRLLFDRTDFFVIPEFYIEDDIKIFIEKLKENNHKINNIELYWSSNK